MANVIRLAALHSLCNFLGYDEGNFYMDFLEKKNPHQKYSHSKSYRILKALHDFGAIIKTRSLEKENSNPSYDPLPPTFLNEDGRIDLKILNYLEKIYEKNYPSFFLEKYIQISMRWGNSLSLYLVQNYMKEYAIVVGGGSEDYELYKQLLSPEDFKKITYICRDDRVKKRSEGMIVADSHLVGSRRLLIIDGKILMDLLRFPKEEASESAAHTKFIGYILSKKLKEVKEKKKGYIAEVEDEVRTLFKKYLI